MAPKTAPVLCRPYPDDEGEIRASYEESFDESKLITISEEELARWAETGEWPERLD